jgi:ubiquinol-cytochrome c reductase cytochrome c1 subunit
MKVAIDPKDAKAWFGANPPDLTVIARSRAGAQGSGADYLYTYLRGFYRDDTRPTGWNNRCSPAWACRMCCGSCRAADGRGGRGANGEHHVKLVPPATPGTMTPRNTTRGRSGGLSAVDGRAAQIQRKQLGVWVLLFLACSCSWLGA